jgi:hypothetical protein
MKLDDLKDNLGDVFTRYWKPALAGAALGGTASGMLSRNAGQPGETPGQRRRRMLRSALTGALLGGTAGVAIPAGFKAVSEPWAAAKPGAGGITDSALGFAGKNIAPLAVAGAGGVGIARSLKANKENAFGQLFQEFRRHAGDAGKGLETADSLRAAMKADPTVIDKVHGILTKGLEGAGQGKLRAAELLSESGFHPGGVPDVKSTLSRLVKPTGSSAGLEGARELLQEGRGLFGKGVAAIPGERGAAASELWRRLVRPTIGGRFSLPTKALALGGGAMLASDLQKKVLGE